MGVHANDSEGRRRSRHHDGHGFLHAVIGYSGCAAAPAARGDNGDEWGHNPDARDAHRGGGMTRRNRMRATLKLTTLMLSVAGVAFTLPAVAQGPRPPDIAGEWRLDSAEDPGQPPLADYLGLAL